MLFSILCPYKPNVFAPNKYYTSSTHETGSLPPRQHFSEEACCHWQTQPVLQRYAEARHVKENSSPKHMHPQPHQFHSIEFKRCTALGCKTYTPHSRLPARLPWPHPHLATRQHRHLNFPRPRDTHTCMHGNHGIATGNSQGSLCDATHLHPVNMLVPQYQASDLSKEL